MITPTSRHKIDWLRVILDINAAGVPSNHIQDTCKMDWRTLGHLRRGEVSEPRFSRGIALLEMHAKHCPEKHDINRIAIGARR